MILHGVVLTVWSCCGLVLIYLYMTVRSPPFIQDMSYAEENGYLIAVATTTTTTLRTPPPPPPSPLPMGNPNAADHPYFEYLPFPRRVRHEKVAPSYRESSPPAFTGECASELPEWKTCDAPVCAATALPEVPELPDLFGDESQRELVQRMLRRAWGNEPPMIDLYVRTGCGGALELAYMLHTLVLFYPAFLGDIIIVLDVNDKPTVDFIVPKQLLAAYSVHVVFEHQPCMSGRIFNQYSYLNLHKYSQAEFVMTIDSDCAFHRPVTPDVLFNRKGELILPTSVNFQPTFWHGEQFFFTKVDDRAWGHSMVSQPVSFKVESFARYLDFAQEQSTLDTRLPNLTLAAAAADVPLSSSLLLPPPVKCYERVLIDFFAAAPPHGLFAGLYCWMCQMSTYIKHTQQPGYHVMVTDESSTTTTTPFLRYASHVSYEKAPNADYHVSVIKSTVQGMCYWVGGGSGAARFPQCNNINTDFEYLHALMFSYAGYDLNQQYTAGDKDQAMATARQRLEQCF